MPLPDDDWARGVSESDWTAALRQLRDNPRLSDEMGQAGRERVIMHYSLRRNLPILAEVIRKTAGKGT